MRQISDIRRQMARAEVFRGYRSATVGFSGLLGVTAAIFQPMFVPAPQEALDRYLVLWVGVAAISLLVSGVELAWRSTMSGPGVSREMTRLAVEQFLPCVVVGALITLAIYQTAPEVAWMLPGLWCFTFGLGVFASYRLLPPQVFWIGSYYLLCGLFCLLYGRGENAFAAWQMGVSFGGGQLLAAVLLYWTLERNDAA